MDFSYTPEQLEIKKGIREWCKGAPDRRRHRCRQEPRHRSPRLPRLADGRRPDGCRGMYGLPAEYGGKPVDHVTMAMIIEELNHAGGNIPMAPNPLIMFDMCEFGNPVSRSTYAIDYYKENGYPPYCLAISEPGAGSDNQGMETCATKDADGKIHINGTKTWVTSGENSGGFIVVCKDEDPSRDNKEMSMYLVASTLPPADHRAASPRSACDHAVLDDPLRRRRGRESALLGIRARASTSS